MSPFSPTPFISKRPSRLTSFIDLLRASFKAVDVIPHKEAWAELPKRNWDLIVVWQHRYQPEELEAFGADRVVLVPMYDDTPLDESFWRKYRRLQSPLLLFHTRAIACLLRAQSVGRTVLSRSRAHFRPAASITTFEAFFGPGR